MTSRTVRKITVVLAATAIAAAITFRAVSEMAAKRFPASPEVGLAAAMAGLFAGGIAALIAILIVARKGASSRD